MRVIVHMFEMVNSLIDAFTKNLLQNQNLSHGNLQACDDGCGAYIDFFASLRHLPSLWQSPSEESRLENESEP